MANYGKDFRDAARNTERHARSASQSAAQSAQSNAATAKAAQSAATGAWLGAGFQAASAFQQARAARAQEEQLAVQQVRAEQEQMFHFKMWSQQPDGRAFLEWRQRAFQVAQFLRNREAEWLSGWARAIGQAQAETPEDEKQLFMQYPARLQQGGLKIASVVSFVLAGLFTLGLLFQLFAMGVTASVDANDAFTYEQCIEALNDPDNFLLNESDCKAIKPNPAGPLIQQVVPLALFLGLGITLVAMRKTKQRAARSDPTVANESQARIQRWGFDPLAVSRGYSGFSWTKSPNVNNYADRIMHLAQHGHTTLPAQSELIPLHVPATRPSQRNHPAEVNDLLAKFAQERQTFG